MRKFGSFLIGAGVVLGVTVPIAMLGGIPLPALPWLVAVGMAKLVLLGSAGMMAAGAVCIRLARREEERKLIESAAGRDALLRSGPNDRA